jgi:hypothetical protein
LPKPLLISVPLPTVTGREEYLEKAVAAYEAHANVEILLYKDLPNCGLAWAKGAEESKGDFIHFGADDVEMHPGWWEAATRFCNIGILPAPRILNTDGSLQSCGNWEVEMVTGAIPEFTRGPFVSRSQWDRMSDLVVPFLEVAHYYTDNIFSWVGRRIGLETAVCRGYEYTHHMAEAKRGAGTTWQQRMQQDHERFQHYTRKVAS